VKQLIKKCILEGYLGQVTVHIQYVLVAAPYEYLVRLTILITTLTLFGIRPSSNS